jgi:PIN domain nuclease of toxin-antitoxin system
LGQRARSAIFEATRVYVSAATVWELTIKAMLGKLVIPAKLSEHVLAQGLFLRLVTADRVLLALERDFLIDASK